MSEMVERGARAIAKRRHWLNPTEPEPRWEEFLHDAHAVICAMRMPTQAMIDACGLEGNDDWTIVERWKSMTKAMLD